MTSGPQRPGSSVCAQDVSRRPPRGQGWLFPPPVPGPQATTALQRGTVGDTPGALSTPPGASSPQASPRRRARPGSTTLPKVTPPRDGRGKTQTPVLLASHPELTPPRAATPGDQAPSRSGHLQASGHAEPWLPAIPGVSYVGPRPIQLSAHFATSSSSRTRGRKGRDGQRGKPGLPARLPLGWSRAPPGSCGERTADTALCRPGRGLLDGAALFPGPTAPTAAGPGACAPQRQTQGLALNKPPSFTSLLPQGSALPILDYLLFN